MSLFPKFHLLKENEDPDQLTDEEEKFGALRKRHGSGDTKKLTWSQKLLAKNMFSKKQLRSGNVTPTDRLSQLKADDYTKYGRSNSIDLGGTQKSPLQPRKMYRQYEDLIEGVQSLTASDVDREVQTITTKRNLNPPPGTTEYLVSGNESLASIAAKLKSTTSELIKINKMMSSLIFPGQRLFVPTEDYVPIGYGSQVPSPGTSPKPRSGSIDTFELLKQRRKSFDESKKGKKSKNRAKERRPSEDLTNLRKNATVHKDARFSARVDYVTGDKGPYVSGRLQITGNEVKFESDIMENEGNLLKDLVQHRMSLAKAMIAANVIDKNPYSMTQVKNQDADRDEINQHSPNRRSNDVVSSQKNQASPIISDSRSRTSSGTGEGAGAKERSMKAEDFWDEYENNRSAISFGSTKNNENDEDKRNGDETDHTTEATLNDENKGVLMSPESPSSRWSSSFSPSLPSPGSEKYLLVKLGVAAKARPAISSLIRGSLPVSETVSVDHCFLIPKKIVAELTAFLKDNFPDAYGKTDAESLEKFDSIDDLIKEPAPRHSRQFRRTLSVAELCNLPLPEMSNPSSILTETHIRLLREHLLTNADGRPWSLVYGTSIHGYSMGTLYRSMIKTDSTTLLVIADMENKVFGAMLPNSIRQSEGFYGNGETFLFTFHPFFKKFCWTGKNSFFLKGNPTNFFIGASDGEFGLWIHDNLDHGRTQRCETFDNDPLTAASEDFNIRCIEVWQFPFSLD